MDSDNPSFDLYATVTKTVIDALEKGVAPWRRPWHRLSGPPTSLATGRPYRGVNVILLSLAPFADHRWLTFRQAREKGGRVKPGERSTLVTFWKFAEKDEEGKERRPPVLRYYRVFNAEQCEGLGLPELYVPEDKPHDRIERAELLVRHMPEPPTIAEGGVVACYRPPEDRVEIPKLSRFRTPDDYYTTLFHELGHATGHASRLARKGVTERTRFGSGEYGREELVAELASAFLSAKVRLDGSLLENHAGYLQGWLGVLREDPKALVVASAQAQRAADRVLGVRYEAD